VARTPPAPDVLASIEEGVSRTASRLPGVPVEQVVLLKLVRHVAGEMHARLTAQLRRDGLNESDFQTLMALFSSQAGTSTPGELCHYAHESRTNMTRITDGLVARGLVLRAPSAADRRRIELRLSARGERVVRGLLPRLFPSLEALFAPLSARDRASLRRLLAQLALQLQLMETPEGSPA
jgi:MarR family transcriptional repressor of emrRAB